MKKLWSTGRNWSLVALSTYLILNGCGAPPQDEELLSESQQRPLNGIVGFDSTGPCNANQELLIRNAVSRARAQLTQGDENSSSLLDVCLRNSIISEMQLVSPEGIRQDAKTFPSVFSCNDLSQANAEAPLLSYPEVIRFDRTYLNNQLSSGGGANGAAAIREVASVLLHEVAHSHGYNHHDTRRDSGSAFRSDYQTMAPVQLQACSRKLSDAPGSPTAANGVSRDAFFTEAVLSKVGQRSEAPFNEIYCSSERLATAFNIRFDSAAEVISNFQMRCQKAGSADNTTAWANASTSGTSATTGCPAGQVAVGALFTERRIVTGGFPSSNYPVSVAIVCNNESDVVANRRFWTPGTSAGLPFRGPYFDAEQQTGDIVVARQCPLGMAIKGFKGRASAATVGELEIICQAVGSSRSSVKLPVQSSLASAGTFPGSQRRTSIERCAGNGILAGLTYSTSTYVNRMGGTCAEVGTLCSNGVCSDFATVPTNYALPSNGVWTGTYNEDRCPSNAGLVGINLLTDSNGIVAAAGVCAPISDWSKKLAPATTTLTRRGGSTGTSTSRMCAAGSFLTGWKIEHSDTRVKGLVLRCRDF